MIEKARFALIADIGGTRARFALVDGDGGLHDERILAVRDHPSLVGAVRTYLESIGSAVVVDRAAVGIASAIQGDRVKMTNLSWDFSIEAVRKELGLESLNVINDLAAMALAIPHVDAANLFKIGAGRAVEGKPMIVVAPGTGLGVSALVPGRVGMVPISSEGGHATLAPADDEEAAIAAQIRMRFGHASAERALTGAGLVNLYTAISVLAGAVPDPDIDPAMVAERGIGKTCPHCKHALTVFSALLGGFAGNMALTFLAVGGVYVAGGVVARLGAGFDETAFRQRFEAKGRFRDYLSGIPTYRISHDTLAFLGLPHAL